VIRSRAYLTDHPGSTVGEIAWGLSLPDQQCSRLDFPGHYRPQLLNSSLYGSRPDGPWHASMGAAAVDVAVLRLDDGIAGGGGLCGGVG
jgi:hypothetical protein